MQQLVSSVTSTHEYDRGLLSLLHDQLHWLQRPRTNQVQARCHDPPVSGVKNKSFDVRSDPNTALRSCTAVSSRHLRSSVDCTALSRIIFGRRAFSVAHPMFWNALPTEFRCLSVSFGDFIGAPLSRNYSCDCIQCNRDACMMLRYIGSHVC